LKFVKFVHLTACKQSPFKIRDIRQKVYLYSYVLQNIWLLYNKDFLNEYKKAFHALQTQLLRCKGRKAE